MCWLSQNIKLGHAGAKPTNQFLSSFARFERGCAIEVDESEVELMKHGEYCVRVYAEMSDIPWIGICLL
jgi:hypothetical protein